MKAAVGDDILIDSERAGEPPRKGEILEILEADYGTSYRVRWDDDHVTVIHPIGGTVQVRRHGQNMTWEQPAHES